MFAFCWSQGLHSKNKLKLMTYLYDTPLEESQSDKLILRVQTFPCFPESTKIKDSNLHNLVDIAHKLSLNLDHGVKVQADSVGCLVIVEEEHRKVIEARDVIENKLIVLLL